MDLNMINEKTKTEVDKIIKWFIENHGKEWVKDNKIISWAKKLGIILNNNEMLDEDSLFHLFVLSVLWNSEPTYIAEKGEEVFNQIKDIYTLQKFKESQSNKYTEQELFKIAKDKINNVGIFNLLNFIANGKINGHYVWTEINEILIRNNIGDKKSDIDRLKELYFIFNGKRYYEGKAYLTKKTFLIFREIKIQFRNSGNFQYNPVICCVPDSHVINALKKLGVNISDDNNIENLLKASEIVAAYFCNYSYELFDLPLFFADKEGYLYSSSTLDVNTVGLFTHPTQGKYAGKCPQCGSALVWRRAPKTNELYRGCTNYKGGCRWNDRSY